MIDERTILEVLEEFKKDGYDCFSSEAQLRDAFAIKLQTLYPHCVVIPEYTIPRPSGWPLNEKNNIFLDLRIEDTLENENIVIEFKYKTSQGTISCYAGKNIRLGKQSDTTNSRYAIWRDICRIEKLLAPPSSDLCKGFLVFITNNTVFCNAPRSTNLDYEFSTEETIHKAGGKEWLFSNHKPTSIHNVYLGDNKPLMISNDYFFKYSSYSTPNDAVTGKAHEFKQLVVPIYSESKRDAIENDLEKMGKSVFVDYYDDFKSQDSQHCKNVLKNKTNYTDNSIDTRVKCGISIFKNKKEIEALRNIFSSSKVPEALRDKAKDILEKELY